MRKVAKPARQHNPRQQFARDANDAYLRRLAQLAHPFPATAQWVVSRPGHVLSYADAQTVFARLDATP